MQKDKWKNTTGDRCKIQVQKKEIIVKRCQNGCKKETGKTKKGEQMKRHVRKDSCKRETFKKEECIKCKKDKQKERREKRKM